MMNEREILIQELLERTREPKQADIAGWECEFPGEVGMTDLMAVALTQVQPETADRVEDHVTRCKYCRQALEVYRATSQDTPLEMPPVKGSALELAARGLPAPPPRPIHIVVAEWYGKYSGPIAAIAFGIVVLLGAWNWKTGALAAEQREMIRILEIIRLGNEEKNRILLNDLERLTQESEIAYPFKPADPKAFSVVQGRNRIRVAGKVHRLYIREVNIRWGTGPNDCFTIRPNDMPATDPHSNYAEFDKESPELTRIGSVIVAQGERTKKRQKC